MLVQLLLCITLNDDTALMALKHLLGVCRQSVARQPQLGAALLFTGDCAALLVEGPADAVQGLHDQMRAISGVVNATAWQQMLAVAHPRVLQPAACALGYLEREGCEELDAPTLCVAARIDAFLQWMQQSDLD